MPHRLTTTKRFRISDDILLLILEKVDPVTLYRTCKAFKRVFLLVREFQHLQYKYELAVVGMNDGPVPHSTRSALARLALLTAYKKDWPRLIWSDEWKLSLPVPVARVDLSGDFLYSVGPQFLDLVELPSCRTGRAPHQKKFMTTPPPLCVIVDAAQSLIVACHSIPAPGGQVGLRLKVRNLCNFEKHPKARARHFDCPSQVAQPVAQVTGSVSAAILLVSVEFLGGLMKHLLINWQTFDAKWLDDLDAIILNHSRVLGVRKFNGKFCISLYNISNIRNVFVEREYELPPIWSKAVMRFGRNSAPNSDYSPPTALFYSDPTARVLILTAKQPGDRAISHCMFISESFFRPTPHADRSSVPWSYWNQFCLIRELPSTVLGQLQIVGNRILYLEKFERGRSESVRINIISFAPYAEEHPPRHQHWTLIGPQFLHIPYEYAREIPQETTAGLTVTDMRATEDNVVLLFETHGDIKPVNVLTFGVATSQPVRPTY